MSPAHRWLGVPRVGAGHCPPLSHVETPMRLPFLTTFLLLACTSTREVRSHSGDAPPASLELLKKLAGTWVTVDEQGKPTAQVSSVFRVTAGGSAVEETVFPGTENEMVTLYFVRKGVLQLTHYCMVGNQPHMLARATESASELEFRCDGTGVDSENDAHMHHARVRLTEDGRLETRWQFLEQGKEKELAVFKLARQTK